MELFRKAADVARANRLGAAVGHRVYSAQVLLGTGAFTPVRPDKIARAVWQLQRWGNTPAGAVAVGTITHPDQEMLIDELGSLTFAEIDRATRAVARARAKGGVGHSTNAAVMCRNHRYFIEATVALSKLGANTLYLNTAFAAPQIAEVVERERAGAIIYDSEFEDLVGGALAGRSAYVAWDGDGDGGIGRTLEEMITSGDEAPLTPPHGPCRVVILTSGTTGTPNGATRSQPKNLDPAVAFLSLIPPQGREPQLVAAS